jgi:glycine hydroxymethyltransferase
MPYRLDEKSGLIDYEALERNVPLFRPKLIIAGACLPSTSALTAA